MFHSMFLMREIQKKNGEFDSDYFTMIDLLREDFEEQRKPIMSLRRLQ